MNKKPKLVDMMQEELPSIGYQKRLSYRTTYEEVIDLYRLINKTVFNSKLAMPTIEVMPRCRTYWGICFGEHHMMPKQRSYCKIRVMDKWYCKQWLISTLAHEMCHQYTWDILGEERRKVGKEPLMSHGPTFYIFRERLAENGISLKRYHRRSKWFKTQDLFKS